MSFIPHRGLRGAIADTSWMNAAQLQAYSSTQQIFDAYSAKAAGYGARAYWLKLPESMYPAGSLAIGYINSDGQVTAVYGGSTGNRPGAYFVSADVLYWDLDHNPPPQLPAGYQPAGAANQAPADTAAAQQAIDTAARPAQPEQQPGFSFANSSRGDATWFVVGDGYTVSITGRQPGARVRVIANGAAADMGTIDAAGRFQLAGIMTSAEIGAWTEQWYVADQLAGTLHFSVTAAQSTATSESESTATDAVSEPFDLAAPATAYLPEWMPASLRDLPAYVWIGAAVGALLYMRQ